MKTVFEFFMMWWCWCYMCYIIVENDIARFVTRNAFKIPDIDIIQNYGYEEVTVTGPEATSVDAGSSLIVDFFENRPVNGSIWNQFCTVDNYDIGCVKPQQWTFGHDLFHNGILDSVFDDIMVPLSDIQMVALIGGLEGYGAPPHKHWPSINLLLSGQKEWWFEDGTTFIQNPGDMIRVPDQMEHWTKNHKDGWSLFLVEKKYL